MAHGRVGLGTGPAEQSEPSEPSEPSEYIFLAAIFFLMTIHDTHITMFASFSLRQQ